MSSRCLHVASAKQCILAPMLHVPFQQLAAAHPERPAVHHDDGVNVETVSYGQLHGMALAVCAALQELVGRVNCEY